MNFLPANMISVGRFLRPVGLSGRFKIKIYAKGSKSLVGIKQVYLSRGSSEIECFEVEELSVTANAALMKLKGVNSVEEAIAFKNCEICIDSATLPKLETGEYYHHQLINSQVYSLDGRYIGKLVSILSTKSNDVFCVARNDKEYLIPVIDTVIRVIDINNKVIKIDVIEGLLDD